MLRRRRTVLACALTALLLGMSGCTIPTTDSGGGYGPSGQKAGQALKQPDQPPPVVLKSGVPGTLKARDSRWWPGRYVVDSGAGIILRVSNSDSTQHNFTLEGEGVSKNLPSGEQLELKFSAPGPGRHRFYCKYHREEMQGWITVQ